MTTKTSNSNLTIAAMFIATLCAYVWLMQPSLTGPFFFDDFVNLEHLAIIQGNIAANWGDYLAAFEGSIGRPIAALSFLINDQAWPANPYSFKLTNVLIHLLNGVLVFIFLRQLAKLSPQLPQHIVWPLLAMTAWLFHPIQISTQMLVVQRMTLLSATFSLAGLWTYLFLLQHSRTWLGALGAMVALGTATILAILCKENGALLPIYALVLNATLLSASLKQKVIASRRLIYISCALPSLIIICMIIQIGWQTDAFSHREFTLAERMFTQCHALFDYLKEILFPSLTGSGIYHDDFPIAKSLIEPVSTLFLAMAIIGSISWAIWKHQTRTIVSFAILWFFAGHIMESTVIPLEMYFEHRNYLPLLGIVIAVTAIPFHMELRRKIGFFFLGIWLATLTAITALQAPVWGNTAMLVTFWTTDHPKSLRATQELAKYYFDTADPQESINITMYAYENGINSADLPLAALLTSCWRMGTGYSTSLLELSKNAIQKSPFSNGSLVVLQKLNKDVQEDNCPDVIDRQSWWLLSDALLANPKFKKAGEGFIRIERAKLRISENNLAGTMTELEAAYAYQPSVELSYKIAEILLTAGLLVDAEKWLHKGLAIKRPWLKEILSSDKKKSETLLKLIQQAKKQIGMNALPAPAQKKD